MQLVFIFLGMLFCLEAKILETNRIEDVLLHLDEKSWLLFDIDDTLLEGENQLGRAEWYSHEIQKLLLRGHTAETAQKTFYPQWILSQILCPIRTVEPNTAAVVAKAQKRSRHVLGLTGRHPSIAALSAEQLSKLQIDLSKSAPPFPEAFDWKGTKYQKGIWFITDFLSKNEAFSRLLAVLSENGPKRIVFVNSAREDLEEMEKSLDLLKIEFIGIHYTKAHERPFDPKIADLQYSRLPEIFSDAQIETGLEICSETG